MCWTVTPRAVKARGGGGVTRLATSWTASPWTAATRATKIQQLSCDLPFQCRTWPTTETKKRLVTTERSIYRFKNRTKTGMTPILQRGGTSSWIWRFSTQYPCYSHNTHVTPATNPRCCHPWYSLLGASLVYFFPPTWLLWHLCEHTGQACTGEPHSLALSLWKSYPYMITLSVCTLWCCDSTFVYLRVNSTGQCFSICGQLGTDSGQYRHAQELLKHPDLVLMALL